MLGVNLTKDKPIAKRRFVRLFKNSIATTAKIDDITVLS